VTLATNEDNDAVTYTGCGIVLLICNGVMRIIKLIIKNRKG
jgi:hypothetical protein